MIQISYLIWGKFFRKKTALWLMDYHPMLGKREASNPLLKAVWSAFAWLDRKTLSKYDSIVCLDPSIEELVLKRSPKARTRVIPTWTLEDTEHFDLSAKEPFGTLSLLYSGNLGKSHSTETLGRILSETSKTVKVKFSYCGDFEETRRRLAKFAEDCGAEFEHFNKIKNYADMGDFYRRQGFHYGIVLLNESLGGVVSPSKFAGYSTFGLPVLYVGPRKTNTDELCRKMNAGLAFSKGDDLAGFAKRLSDPEEQRKAASNTKNATSRFSKHLAAEVAQALKELLPAPKNNCI